jgi:hypothetical protein
VHKFSTLFLNGNYLMLKLVVDIDIEKYETWKSECCHDAFNRHVTM